MGVIPRLKNIGVLGGTFDPVHNGHLIIAEEARLKLGLERVIFVPAGEPWLKDHRDISPGEDRMAMIRLAIHSNPYFRTSSVDLARTGPSYTVDTLTDLRRELGEEANLYFILGLDAVAEILSWRKPDEIITLCRLVGAKRPGYRTINLKHLERNIPGIARCFIVLDNPLIDISSSVIRERVARGLPITGLVPNTVERYISEKGLYS
jgi:nicotinate-nucleotide adenylyltransferase